MFKRILVPLDGSGLAEAVLPTVKAIAQAFASEITLLRVVSPPNLVSGTRDFAEIYISMFDEMQQEAAIYIEAQKKALHADGFKVNGRTVNGESTADLILDVADELEVDAIAMSTHGRGGIKRWVYGSVADKVLRHAHVPVLLVRAQVSEEDAFTLPDIENEADIHSHDELAAGVAHPEKW
jgi:nucleotide-binding universal stress UspA family protein